MNDWTPQRQALAVKRTRRARMVMAVVLAVISWPIAVIIAGAFGSAMFDLSQGAVLFIATILSLWPFALLRFQDWLNGQ